MTSASNQMITRCPKCGTAFRVTASQLQSAKGAVRCGSCLHVFKAQDSLVATPVAPAKPLTPEPATKAASPLAEPATPANKASPVAPIEPVQSIQPAKPEQSAILSAIKPLTTELPKPSEAATPKQSAPAAPAKPVIRTINTSSLKQEADDILISDDMEDIKAENNSYEFDGFINIDATPKSDVSLFERKIRDKDLDEEPMNITDESWAEMLIEDEEDDTPKLSVFKPKIDADQLDEYNADAQLGDDALAIHQIANESLIDETAPAAPSTTTAATTPGLLFSLVGEQEEPSKAQKQASDEQESDELVLSDELASIPSNQGFNQIKATEDRLDSSIFETPDDKPDSDYDSPKRQVKTQPKIRAYDGSRTALLMNIMPAPIEFNAKRMRRWYQRKLWPSLSILALLALVIQVGWFKFDYFSRVEPYRTGYLFLCPYLGCQVPTLVDTRRILASNLVVRQHPDTEGALAVDVMLINSAPFDQPFPDLTLTFTDIDENQVAARRFVPKDYLGGELAGQELMPQNQKVYITLDLVDPGAEAVNYHISIPRN